MYTLKTDLQRSPTNYSDEYKQYFTLITQNTPLTTVGNLSYTSLSSGIVYTTVSNGGQAELAGLLKTAILTSLLQADDYNQMLRQIEFIKRQTSWGVS